MNKNATSRGISERRCGEAQSVKADKSFVAAEIVSTLVLVRHVWGIDQPIERTYFNIESPFLLNSRSALLPNCPGTVALPRHPWIAAAREKARLYDVILMYDGGMGPVA